METELEVTEVSYKKIVPVRFRPGEKTYSFGTDDLELHKDDEVVVETVRGLEIGTVMAEPAEGKPELDSVIKPVIRKATSYDLSQQARNKADEPEAMERCRAAIDQCGLPMVLTSAEYTLDRSKIIFTYVAEERVDFRELLKVLASMFRTRIELRQIGPRDKAKIVGGIGICGMTLCCNRFQKDFGTISINMAKNQLLALNPQKLSGQCGKLMCCLAYENEDYKILRQGLPKMNASVIYNGNRYRITSMNVLDNSARLSNAMEVVDMSLDDLKALIKFNEEHDINIQNFMKAQRERELEMRSRGETETETDKRKPAQRQRVDLREKKDAGEKNVPEEPVIPAEIPSETEKKPSGETGTEKPERRERPQRDRDRNRENRRENRGERRNFKERGENRKEERGERPERSERPRRDTRIPGRRRDENERNANANPEKAPAEKSENTSGEKPDRDNRRNNRINRGRQRRPDRRNRKENPPKTEGE